MGCVAVGLCLELRVLAVGCEFDWELHAGMGGLGLHLLQFAVVQSEFAMGAFPCRMRLCLMLIG